MERLDQLCQSMFPAGIPGAAVGVLAGRSRRFLRGFGLADLREGTPFTPATQFRAGSVTKISTWAASWPGDSGSRRCEPTEAG